MQLNLSMLRILGLCKMWLMLAGIRWQITLSMSQPLGSGHTFVQTSVACNFCTCWVMLQASPVHCPECVDTRRELVRGAPVHSFPAAPVRLAQMSNKEAWGAVTAWGVEIACVAKPRRPFLSFVCRHLHPQSDCRRWCRKSRKRCKSPCPRQLTK